MIFFPASCVSQMSGFVAQQKTRPCRCLSPPGPCFEARERVSRLGKRVLLGRVWFLGLVLASSPTALAGAFPEFQPDLYRSAPFSNCTLTNLAKGRASGETGSAERAALCMQALGMPLPPHALQKPVAFSGFSSVPPDPPCSFHPLFARVLGRSFELPFISQEIVQPPGLGNIEAQKKKRFYPPSFSLSLSPFFYFYYFLPLSCTTRPQ